MHTNLCYHLFSLSLVNYYASDNVLESLNWIMNRVVYGSVDNEPNT